MTARTTWGISLTHRRAKLMRRNPTSAESLLWEHLRRKELGGVRFRRQFPVGNFIADFCCREHRLIIELDGVHHDEQQAKDEWRSRKLQAWGGYRVLRFRNEDVLENLDGTLENIW